MAGCLLPISRFTEELHFLDENWIHQSIVIIDFVVSMTNIPVVTAKVFSGIEKKVQGITVDNAALNQNLWMN